MPGHGISMVRMSGKPPAGRPAAEHATPVVVVVVVGMQPYRGTSCRVVSSSRWALQARGVAPMPFQLPCRALAALDAGLRVLVNPWDSTDSSPVRSGANISFISSFFLVLSPHPIQRGPRFHSFLWTRGISNPAPAGERPATGIARNNPGYSNNPVPTRHADDSKANLRRPWPTSRTRKQHVQLVVRADHQDAHAQQWQESAEPVGVLFCPDVLRDDPNATLVRHPAVGELVPSRHLSLINVGVFNHPISCCIRANATQPIDCGFDYRRQHRC
ncbi:hypothetical protein Purlil1_3002 [Purpureocillium lilacinum]|uniref:Uncharacterized protein n=1 Tax=Purpureocillium lilacinum TaxID=33203 RepID=A0ABR0C7Q6_PURLI|nr:hypothetical protein Purlil1_3002 [Purpureocillium lilacinum]